MFNKVSKKNIYIPRHKYSASFDKRFFRTCVLWNYFKCKESQGMHQFKLFSFIVIYALLLCFANGVSFYFISVHLTVLPPDVKCERNHELELNCIDY